MNHITRNLVIWIVGLPFAPIFSVWRLINYFIMLKDVGSDLYSWPNEWSWKDD